MIGYAMGGIEGVSDFYGQLDKESQTDLASNLINFGQMAMDFYSKLNGEDKKRADTLLAQAETVSFDWASGIPENNREQLFQMLTQTDYGVHSISGERTPLTNHLIDFFKSQPFTQKKN